MHPTIVNVTPTYTQQILTYFDTRDGKLGENSDKVFNDLEGVDELVNLPSEAFPRNVDEIVLNSGTQHADSVKTAIVCPPTIYGPSNHPLCLPLQSTNPLPPQATAEAPP